MTATPVAVAVLAALAVTFCSAPNGGGRVRSMSAPAVLGVLALAVVLVVPRISAIRLVLILILIATSADLARVWRRRRRAAQARLRRAHVLSTCELLAADVRAGLAPQAALLAASGRWPDLVPVARAAELGADVPEALRAVAATAGAGSLRVVAAAWQVAHHSGAGLAPALDLAATTLRDERDATAVVATELASARATANLLAVLPAGVLLLGAGVGGDPWSFLLGSVPGLTCLGAGLGLTRAGLAWIDAIAEAVGR